jgi:regulatory protein
MLSIENRRLSNEEIDEKIRHFCAWQERSRLQVLRKLKKLGCLPENEELILNRLTEEGYLNEKRFVAQFVRSRSSVKGWGPAKISAALFRETGQAHAEILKSDPDSEQKALDKLIRDVRKKNDELVKKNDGQLRVKLMRFCLSRGFTHETSLEVLALVFSESGRIR